MRRWKSSELDKKINEKRAEVDRFLLTSRQGKIIRRRPRDKEEQNVLDMLCKKKWEDDLARGKIKILSRRKWYYEFD